MSRMEMPGLVTRLRTPRVLWHQTDLTVVLRIMLQDVDEYFLEVDSEYLTFSTTVNDIDYGLILYFFGAVVPGQTSHAKTGREIKITLAKAHKWLDWLRLQLSERKNPMISFDMEHVDRNDRSNNWIKPKAIDIEEYKAKNFVTHIRPDVPSSDEEDSDDEAMDKLFL